MKTFKLTVTEDELKALINHHSRIIQNSIEDGALPSIDTSERIHNLTKRLNKDTPEIEPAQATAAKDEQQTSW